MSTPTERSSNTGEINFEERASRSLVFAATALLAIALTLAAWLIFTTGATNVSAAPTADQTPVVPYFPSQYVNQADEPSPVPSTF